MCKSHMWDIKCKNAVLAIFLVLVTSMYNCKTQITSTFPFSQHIPKLRGNTRLHWDFRPDRLLSNLIQSGAFGVLQLYNNESNRRLAACPKESCFIGIPTNKILLTMCNLCMNHLRNIGTYGMLVSIQACHMPVAYAWHKLGNTFLQK